MTAASVESFATAAAVAADANFVAREAETLVPPPPPSPPTPPPNPPPSHPSPPPRLVALDYESSAGGRGDFLGRRGRRFHGVNLKAQNETMMTLNYLTTVFVLTLKPKA